MNLMNIKLTRGEAVMPTRATDGSAGYDLSACIEVPVTVRHGEVVKIPTGVAIELPTGYAALILGRSGLGIKHGVVPANAVGLIDSDYRGEIVVGLTCQKTDCRTLAELHVNGTALGLDSQKDEGYTIQPYERIAQMIIVPVATPELVAVDTLDETARGAGGFGSTGKKDLVL